MTKTELFLELAQPDENGKSRWVNVSEFTGKYASLVMGNGGNWCRGNSTLAKRYLIEKNRKQSPGPSIDAIRLVGFNTQQTFNQAIREDVRDFYKEQNCVMLGVHGSSENTKIEIDHKDGRKDAWRVSDPATQKLEDFQPLCKVAYDVKCQICKKCKETNKRWSAKNIKGNPYDFYEGDENYTESLGCRGCYLFDPVEYRKSLVRRITLEVTQEIMKKYFPDDEEQTSH